MSEGVNEIVYYRRENSKLYAVVMSFIIMGFMSAILTLSILWPEEFTFGLTSNPLITLIRILLQLLLSIICLHYAYILMRTIIIEYILKKPALIINEKGIYDNISYVRLGHISWDEIERVYPYETNFHVGEWAKYSSEVFLGIEFINEELTLSRYNFIKRFIVKLGKISKDRPTAIPMQRMYTTSTGEDPLDFIRRIQSHKIKISAVKRTVEGVKHSLGNQKEVIFYNNGKDLFKALILSFVFILIGYVLIKLDSLWIGRITMISSGLSIAFLIFVLLARKRRPSVVVNQYGVYVGRGFFPGRTVEWKDIQKAYIFQNDGSDFAKIGGFSKILVIRLNKYLEESKADNTDEMIQDIQEVYDTVTQDELENIKEAMLEHTYEDMEIIQTMVNIPLEELLEIIKGMHKKYGNVA